MLCLSLTLAINLYEKTVSTFIGGELWVCFRK